MEISVKSGKALVYFNSDLALNMSGFSISLAYGKCKNGCSGNGRCNDGVCECYEGYTGASCETAICTDKDRGHTSKACSSSGICNADNKCTCDKRFHGIVFTFMIR